MGALRTTSSGLASSVWRNGRLEIRCCYAAPSGAGSVGRSTGQVAEDDQWYVTVGAGQTYMVYGCGLRPVVTALHAKGPAE